MANRHLTLSERHCIEDLLRLGYVEGKIAEIIGFSNYVWNHELSRALAARIKAQSPKTITVMGGPNYPVETSEQESYLHTHPEIDFFVVGEGELAFANLVASLIRNGLDKKKLMNRYFNEIQQCGNITDHEMYRTFNCGIGMMIFIPPNNWDSMAYHLPRIQHWIQNGNVYPYPTNITRQIATSPLSEYIILNIQVLASTDAFSNLVQYFALINTIFLATLILKSFQVNYKVKYLP